LLRGVLKAYGVEDRYVWRSGFLPGTSAVRSHRYPADRGSDIHQIASLAVSVDEVRENFRRYGLLDSQCASSRAGSVTLFRPCVRAFPWSIVRMDGDMHGSTMDALVNLYEGLSPGGFLIVDDFAHEPCRTAVEDFVAVAPSRSQSSGLTGRVSSGARAGSGPSHAVSSR
jgi:O-methyltransferase